MTRPLLFIAALAALLAAPASAQTCTSDDDIVVASEPNENPSLGGGQEIGQSLTAPCDGFLLSITVEFSLAQTTGPTIGTFRLYDGEGTGGAVLATVPYSSTEAGPYTFEFPEAVAVTAGSPYTFFLDVDDATSGGNAIEGDLFGPYDGGTFYQGAEPESATPNGAFDLGFIADLEPNGDASDPVEVDVTPSSTDVSPGGSVSFSGLVMNTTDAPLELYASFLIEGPNGSTTRRNIGSGTLRAGASTNLSRFPGSTISIPSSAPEGMYTVTLQITEGSRSGDLIASETFVITVSQSLLSAAVPASAELTVSAPEAVPNPFRDRAEIRYGLTEAAEVDLRVFDALGREVAALVSTTQSAGTHAAAFDAGDLPSGVYVWRLAIGGDVTTGRITLAR